MVNSIYFRGTNKRKVAYIISQTGEKEEREIINERNNVGYNVFIENLWDTKSKTLLYSLIAIACIYSSDHITETMKVFRIINFLSALFFFKW